jgi:hypothetical protein
MPKYTERELELILEARKDQRLEILELVEKFVRTSVTPEGEKVSEIKIPPSHLSQLINTVGVAGDYDITKSV